MNKTVIRPARFDPQFSNYIDRELERRNMTFSAAVREALRLFFGLDTYNGSYPKYGTLVDPGIEYQTD